MSFTSLPAARFGPRTNERPQNERTAPERSNERPQNDRTSGPRTNERPQNDRTSGPRTNERPQNERTAPERLTAPFVGASHTWGALKKKKKNPNTHTSRHGIGVTCSLGEQTPRTCFTRSFARQRENPFHWSGGVFKRNCSHVRPG